MDVFAGLAISGTLAFAKLASSSFKFAKDFEMAMLEVQTISQAVNDDFQGMSAQIIAVGAEVPDTAVGVAKAFYQIVSAGNDGAAAMDILRSSTKLAVGTITDTETAADALTGIMNAYGKNIGNAASVSDDLFTIIKNGKTTMSELAPSIVQVTGLAAQAGLSWKDLATAFATGTKTIKTDILTTGIKGFLTAVINQSKDAADEAKRLGLTFNIQALQTKGLAGFLQDVIDKTDGNIESMSKLFPNVRGLTGVLSLAGEEGKVFAEQSENMAKSTGAVTEAFDIMIKSAENQAKVLKNNIAVALKPLGDVLLGKVTDIKMALNEMFATGEMDDVIKTLEKMAKIVGILTVSFVSYKVAILAATMVTKGAVIVQKLYEGAMMASWVAQTLFRKGLKAMIIEMKALSAVSKTTGFGLLIAGIAAVVLAVKALKKETNELSKVQEIAAGASDRYAEKMGEEKLSLDMLFRALKNTKKGTEERKKAINDINTAYGDYLPNLLTEKSTAEDITKAYEALNTAISDKIKLQVMEQQAASLLTEQIKLEKERDALIEKGKRKKTLLAETRKGEKLRADIREHIKLIKDTEDAYQDLIGTMTEMQGVEVVVPPGGGGGGGGGGEAVAQTRGGTMTKLETKSPLGDIKASRAYTKKLLKLVESTQEKLESIDAKYLNIRLGIDQEYTGQRKEEALKLMEFHRLNDKKAVTEAAANFEFQEGAYRDMVKDIRTLSGKQLLARKQYLSEELLNVENSVALEKLLREDLAKTEDELNQRRLYALDVTMEAMREIRSIMEDSLGIQNKYLESFGDLAESQLTMIERAVRGDVAGALVVGVSGLWKHWIKISTISKGVTEDLTEAQAQLNHEMSLNEKIMQNLTGAALASARETQIDLINQQIEATEALMAAEEAAQKGYLFGLFSKDVTDPEAMRRYEQELAELYSKQAEVQNATRAMVTQTTAESIADGIAQGFADGKSAQQVFADTFEDMMRKAMVNSIKDTILNEELKQWYNNFAAFAGDEEGLTEEEVAQLRESFRGIVDKGEALAKAMDKVLGEEAGSVSPGGLTGAIRGVTEETAGVLAGQMNSIRVNVAQNVLILQDMSEYLSEISMNTTYNHNLKLIYELMKKNQTDDSLRGLGL